MDPEPDYDSYELQGPDNRRLILNEDECGAAYAYLVDDEIAGDVWLYNFQPAPAHAPWQDPEAAPPFRNPAALTKDDSDRRRLRDVECIDAVWREDGVVELFLDDRLEARLWRGSSPGQSYMAASGGPLAMRLPAE